MTTPIQASDSTYIVQACDSNRTFTDEERIAAHRTELVFNGTDLSLEVGDTLVIKNGKAKPTTATAVTVPTQDLQEIASQKGTKTDDKRKAEIKRENITATIAIGGTGASLLAGIITGCATTGPVGWVVGGCVLVAAGTAAGLYYLWNRE